MCFLVQFCPLFDDIFISGLSQGEPSMHYIYSKMANQKEVINTRSIDRPHHQSVKSNCTCFYYKRVTVA